jgi:hypothetical protein
MARAVIEARVIPWELEQNQWGVAVRCDDDTREAWAVGDRRAAELEAALLKRGGASARRV